jgi:hypothetical protein
MIATIYFEFCANAIAAGLLFDRKSAMVSSERRLASMELKEGKIGSVFI